MNAKLQQKVESRQKETNIVSFNGLSKSRKRQVVTSTLNALKSKGIFLPYSVLKEKMEAVNALIENGKIRHNYAIVLQQMVVGDLTCNVASALANVKYFICDS